MSHMDHDYFWKNIQNEFGHVQVHLQNILKVQNLCNNSITYLTRDAILGIQKDMRALAEHYTATSSQSSSGTTNALSLRDIYGTRWENNPQGFTFMEGEILCLLGVASYVHQKGIESFLKFSKHQNQNHSAPLIPPPSKDFAQNNTRAEIYASNLIKKIKGFYGTQNISNPKYDQFVAKLDNLEVHSLTISDNQVRATILCPACAAEGNERKTSFRMDPNGRWHLWTFTRHCDSFHYSMPRGTKRRQCLETDDVNDTMDEGASDSLNLEVDVNGGDESSDDENSN